MILISSLSKLNYSIYFDKSVFIRNNDSFICSDPLVDNLIHITPISILPCVENHHISLKRNIPTTNQTYLWHLYLSHINLNKIQRLVKFGTLYSLVLKDLPVFESYIEGKIIKIVKGVKAKECLCGPAFFTCAPTRSARLAFYL